MRVWRHQDCDVQNYVCLIFYSILSSAQPILVQPGGICPSVHGTMAEFVQSHRVRVSSQKQRNLSHPATSKRQPHNSEQHLFERIGSNGNNGSNERSRKQGTECEGNVTKQHRSSQPANERDDGFQQPHCTATSGLLLPSSLGTTQHPDTQKFAASTLVFPAP